MARRTFRTRMLERHGRQTFWFSGGHVDTVLAAASNATLVSSLNAAALALRPFTVVRTRGFVNIATDQQAATEAQSGAWGVIVVSDQAVAIGVTAVPTPVSDDQSNWLAYESMANRFLFTTGVAYIQSGRERIVDSKAMRKVTEGQDVISVVESSAISNGLIFSTYFRMLIKLH